MSDYLFVRKVKKDESFTQKCCLPLTAIKNSSANVGDFISINCNTIQYLCRVYPSSEPVYCIDIDDTVSCLSETSTSNKVSEMINIYTDISSIKVITCKKVLVKVVFQEASFPAFLEDLKFIITKLIINHVVKKKAVIRCTSQKLFQIDSIIIDDVVIEDNQITHDCVRITRTSTIEISGILSKKQMGMINQYNSIKFGGFKHEFIQLKTCMEDNKRLIVYGPSGCGKSTLIKKFCSDLDCFLLIIDGHETLSLHLCDTSIRQLIKASTLFPELPTILFLDNIDVLLSFQENSVENSKLLSYLMHSLDEYNVIIIATVEHKGLLKPIDLSHFETELFLGVPLFEQRKEMLAVLRKTLGCDIDSDYVAEMTPGFIAGDLKSLMFDLCKKNEEKKESSENLTHTDINEVLQSMTPSLLRTSKWSLKVKPIKWKDIGGMKNIKERLQMCIEQPLIRPEIFRKVDLPTPKGVLLFGPPGCCKTTIARGLATECKANFFAANPSQIYSPFVGESEKNIRELFYEARLCAPSIIFLDEIDSLVGRRDFDTKTIGVAEKVLSELLTEMDGFGVSTAYGGSENCEKFLSYSGNDTNIEEKEQLSDQVIVVAATNRPDLIDDALLRPGRFDLILYVPPPNAEERESILKTYTEDVPLCDVDFKKIAEMAEHFSGADLKHLHVLAAQNAMEEEVEPEFIHGKHYMEALKNIRPSISLKQINMYESLAGKYGTFIS